MILTSRQGPPSARDAAGTLFLRLRQLLPAALVAGVLFMSAGSASSTLGVEPTPVTISFATDPKTYDGTTDATIAASPPCTVEGVIDGDEVTCVGIGATGTFDTRNVGTDKSVEGNGFTLGGADAEKYTIESAAGTGSISQAPLAISAVTDSRIYNGTTSSTATPTYDAGQVQTGDNVTGLVQVFDSRNAGPARTLSVSAYTVNDDNGGLNYAVTTPTANGSISQAPLTVTAITNTKTADGGVSALAVPIVTAGSVFTSTGDNTTGSFSETYDNAFAGSNKTLTPAGVVNDNNAGQNYLYSYVAVSTGRIRPGAVHTLTFTSQPIDTKIATPIYNFCAPGGSPCAGSSAPVQVTARDQYNNLAGPGAPGADGTNAAINVVIRKDNSGGSILGPSGGTATNGGVASFGATLTIPGTFTGKTNLFAITGSPPSAKSTTSIDFRIVNDLAPCRGPLCKNNIGNGGNANALQYLYGQIKTAGSGSYSSTTLTTQFLGARSIDNKCGTNRTINMPVELRAAGTDVSQTNNGYMVLIMPKNTLKALGVTSRGTPSFEICLGALFLGNGTTTYGSTTTPWRAKGGLAIARQDTLATDGDTYWRYWGTPANCGAAGLTSTDPCILLRTKQRSDITALINQGILAAGAADNMRDSDLAIVIMKPSPWDGKGGMY